VWYGFVAPERGAYELAAGGFRLTSAVFRGETLEDLSLVARQGPERRHPNIRFIAEAGDRFSIAVSDPYGFNWGYYRWTLKRQPLYDPVPPPVGSIANVSERWYHRLELRFEAVPQRRYDVESSEDLVHWRHWRAVVPTNSQGYVSLGVPELPANFYRVVAPD
jgi:hypothetical protein